MDFIKSMEKKRRTKKYDFKKKKKKEWSHNRKKRWCVEKGVEGKQNEHSYKKRGEKEKWK